jgi:methyl-accepting chemotaxis protein
MKAASSLVPLIQAVDSYYDLSFPLMNSAGNVLGAVRIGVELKAINSQVYELLVWALAISSLCFVLSIVLIYGSMSKFITKPILTIEKAADRIAAGDLTYSIDIKGRDEVSALGEAINRIAFNLKDMISKIRKITTSVSKVTGNIVVSSQSVLSAADVRSRPSSRPHLQ